MHWAYRTTIGGVILIALAALGFSLFKKPIATSLFERVVKTTAGVDVTESYADGLHIYLCGTGSPMPDANRAGPCIGILAGERAYVFDVGSGGVRTLGGMGFPIAKLHKVYLTHLHSDHIDGLGELMLLAWIGGNRAEPLPIAGPIGTAQVVAGFNQAYTLDKGYRIAHHGTEVAIPSGFGGQAEELAVPAGPNGQKVVFADTDLTITAIQVQHAPIEPAFGYRIDYKDRSLSISGDTVYHPGFVALSEGVDVMLHEALNRDMVATIGAQLAERGQTNTATVFADILDYHTSPEEAAEAAENASARALVLYHLVPPIPVKLLETVFLGQARRKFSGKLHIGEDGVLISLPTGTDTIAYEKLL